MTTRWEPSRTTWRSPFFGSFLAPPIGCRDHVSGHCMQIGSVASTGDRQMALTAAGSFSRLPSSLPIFRPLFRPALLRLAVDAHENDPCNVEVRHSRHVDRDDALTPPPSGPAQFSLFADRPTLHSGTRRARRNNRNPTKSTRRPAHLFAFPATTWGRRNATAAAAAAVSWVRVATGVCSRFVIFFGPSTVPVVWNAAPNRPERDVDMAVSPDRIRRSHDGHRLSRPVPPPPPQKRRPKSARKRPAFIEFDWVIRFFIGFLEFYWVFTEC